MRVTVRCDRCQRIVEGLRTQYATGGFYDVGSQPWAKYSNPGEESICDDCMWADPRYVADFGPRQTTPQEANQ